MISSTAQAALKSTIVRFGKFFSITEAYLEQLRDRWGREHKLYRNRTEIAQLFELTKPLDAAKSVDDATWSDLEMDTVFDRVDNTITPIGRQYLYRQLRRTDADEHHIQQQYTSATHLQMDTEQREQIQLILMAMRSSNGSLITDMLFKELPDGQFPKAVALGLASLSVVTIVIALLFHSLFWLPLLPIVMNFVFSERYAENVGRQSVSFGYLRKMLLTAVRLPKLIQASELTQIEYLRDAQTRSQKLYRQFRLVGLDSTSRNEITAQIAYLLNLICLFDFLIFMRASKRLHMHKQAVIETYEAIASLDSAGAVASYLQMIGKHCNPVFGEGRAMRFKQVCHPLLDDGIANDFDSTNSSALITGSNMAGKSTFIKTIGTNLILAQTLWVCHAESAQIPRVPVLASIKHADSLSEGKSYYFAEIESLLRLIKASQSDSEFIFLIDEILHGTNTVERVASSAAILEYLGRNSSVLVTSHDVELIELLPSNFKSYHFRETGDVNNLFDYQIRSGPCTTKNAISLLESIGFPPDVILAARQFATATSV